MLKDISDRLEKLESKHAVEYHFHSHTNIDTNPAPIMPMPAPMPNPYSPPYWPTIICETGSISSGSGDGKNYQVYNVAEISQ